MKPTEEASGEASESVEEAGEDGEGGEEAGGEIINNKIWEEIESMPQEFETFKEKWKKANDSDIEAVSTLSSTLDQMKERLASMQVQAKPITIVVQKVFQKMNWLFSGAVEGARSNRVFEAGRHWCSGSVKKDKTSELPFSRDWINSIVWPSLTVLVEGKQDQDPDCEHDWAAGAGDC